MTRRCVVPAALLTFLILLAVPAFAQNEVQAIGACTVIDKPGSYVLGNDIKATLADLKRVVPDAWYSGCIVIVADFVSLDLQGHTITGPGDQHTWSHFGIYTTADASGKQSVAARIRNGNVRNFDSGVALEGTGHLVEQMRVTGNNLGISFAADGNRGDGIRVKDVVAVSNGIGIFFYSGVGGSVENCQVISNEAAGIYQNENLESVPLNPRPLGTCIVSNTVTGNGVYGIYAFCPSLILQNMAYGNGSRDQDNIVLVGGKGPCTRSDNNPEP